MVSPARLQGRGKKHRERSNPDPIFQRAYFFPVQVPQAFRNRCKVAALVGEMRRRAGRFARPRSDSLGNHTGSIAEHGLGRDYRVRKCVKVEVAQSQYIAASDAAFQAHMNMRICPGLYA